MEFCPRCGSILVEKRKNDGCARCSYVSKSKVKLKSSEKIGKEQSMKEISVMKDGEARVLPKISAKCKKCGNNEAYFWTVQTRSGDEAETKFFKCVKCEHTWREYR